jgi:hypothetical protein
MKFIRLLQEASELPLSDLKKAMQKDKRVAPALKAAQLTPDQVEDKAAFLSTLKFFVFNNPNVRQFVQSRHNVKDVWKEELTELAKLMKGDLEGEKAQTHLDDIQNFLKRLFREHTHVASGSMSKDLRKELDDWFNSNGRHHDIHPLQQRELMSLPGIRSDKKVLVYRGLLFSEWALQSRTRYDGTLEEGNGLKFLKSIRANKRTVDLTWDRSSSWTKSREIAERFAKYGPASSHFGAMMQWFDRGIKERAIDGQLGFVISTLADPDDVLLDGDRFNATFHLKHGDEGEVILKPGTYLCRVVKKFTQAGEVNPEEQAVENETLTKALAEVDKFAARLTVDPELLKLQDTNWHLDPTTIISRDPKAFRRLALNSTTTELTHSYDKVRDFFNEHLKDLDKSDIRVDGAEANDALRRKLEALKELFDTLKATERSKEFADDPKLNGKGPRHRLNGEQLRVARSTTANKLERDLAREGYLRFYDRDVGRELKQLATGLGLKDVSNAPQQLGAPKQQAFLDKLTREFFDKVNVDRPAETAEAVKLMINLLRKVERNKYLLSIVKTLQDDMKAFTGEDTKDA